MWSCGSEVSRILDAEELMDFGRRARGARGCANYWELVVVSVVLLSVTVW
jgi:hypothetical protein